MGGQACKGLCKRPAESGDVLDQRQVLSDRKALVELVHSIEDAASTCSGPSEQELLANLDLVVLPLPKVAQFLTVPECFRISLLSKEFNNASVVAGKVVVPWLVCTKESACEPLTLVRKVSLENVVAAWFLGIPRAMNALAEALESGGQSMREIVRFSAKGCRVDKSSMPVLQHVFQNGRITLLNLELNQMSDETVQNLVADVLLHDQSLETLNIRSNRLGDAAAKALARLVWHPTLRILNLKSNAIGYEGACELANMLEDTTTLQVLNLRGQIPKLPSAAGLRLAEALKANKSLRRMKLRRNKLGDDVATAFVQALTTGAAKNTLVELDLQQNTLTAEGGAALARFLLTNAVLEVVYVGGNKFTKDDILKKLEGLPLDPRMEFEVMPDV
eukprot:TRINITY_DN24687_c0_g1_i1.p1 TRINITY_DN24687_c0_g1~~TRINITY_DN24687_c0_g1_i1.p1  ORF type:complete len:414 (-),score=91.83 TRINITY_DN24687_c0_g1_i1:296-1465(-)